MTLSDHTESMIADFLAAYDMLQEVNGTEWVRQRDIADVMGVDAHVVYTTANILIACYEIERYEVHQRHVRYKWIGGGQ